MKRNLAACNCVDILLRLGFSHTFFAYASLYWIARS